MNFQSVPASAVSFHAVGARGVLFDGNQQKLYLLNRTAGFIWCCLMDGMDRTQIVRELVSRSNTDPAMAEECVNLALDNWRALGLVDPQGDAVTLSLPDRQVTQPVPADSDMVCRVADAVIALRFSSPELARKAWPLLRAHQADGLLAVQAVLDIEQVDDGVVLRRGNEVMQIAHGDESIAPAVFASLIRLALEYVGYHPALHAAAVRGRHGAVLFAGASGRGKSTLMASLLAEGQDVLCDDTVLLEPGLQHIRPVTPYLCIKAGAWPVLEERLPELASLPIYTRPDGHRARYLCVDPLRTDHGHEVSAIVFPQYQAGARPRMTRIGGFLALRALLPSLDPIGQPLNAGSVERLIEWLGDIPCYSLNYDALDDARAALAELLE